MDHHQLSEFSSLSHALQDVQDKKLSSGVKSKSAFRFLSDFGRIAAAKSALDILSDLVMIAMLMQADSCSNGVVRVNGMSNREFLERYARAGCIGLSGGVSLIDRAICRAERHLDDERKWGAWSHAFVFQGKRADGYHWVIESDLQVHSKHVQLGVQENRISKYFDEEMYTMLAVLDFDLKESEVTVLLSEGLDLVANRARYSLRELLGTLIALRRKEMRGRNNVLARERSLYCSALVRHLFSKNGLNLAPGVDLKNTTPEDLARTAVPHITYWLERQRAKSKVRELRARLRKKLRPERVANGNM